eukprot:TRINITY_DN94764_c0_g1_i1.p1 TRINITY_DN94764_c0_g1~~TRINITY_DN94764_c0_g1_i1.p1  ORF type:complete len:570 (-),score=163.01 TRINITY_DN94764_c0_g1_i1:45-1754(-)
MNNADFQRLLTTNDTALINELTKSNRKKSNSGEGGKSKGRGKDEAAIARIAKANKYKQKALEAEEKAKQEDKYLDRAALRREGKGEFERVAAEWENFGEVGVEQSKYLGGDLDHTHLVKGLDFSLLNKVRTELTKQQKVDEYQKARAERKATGGQKKKVFDNLIAKNIYLAVVETLHPHHGTFKERLSKMSQAISLGQRMRSAPSTFLPGRMAFEFDTDIAVGKSDIPRIVYMSKEDAPIVDQQRRPSGMLPDSAIRVKNAIQRAIEERKQRKQTRELQKNLGKEASYTAAQKIVPKHKAKDADDIFSGAGIFDVSEVVRKARAEQAAKRAGSQEQLEVAPLAQKSSYFDDAGDEKYRKAPEGQIDLDELHVEDKRDEPGEFHKPTGRFKASSKFKGAMRNWVFKLGDQGLGYYEETPPKSAVPPSSSSSAGKEDKKDPRRKREKEKSDKVGMGAPLVADAYDELFPSAMMGGAMVTTGSDDSEEEDGKKKKGLTTTIGKKKGDEGMDSVSANKKAGAEAKKRKLNENQQWQKIDNMIKKGKVSSLESMEHQASKKKGGSSHLATPAFF